MTAAARLVIDEQNPWPGLQAFDETAQRFFNGRQSESAELRRLVMYAPLTVLFGGSGLGKSSLLQAGLFPLLRKGHLLPVYVRLDVRDRAAPLVDQAKFALQAQIHARRIDAPAFNANESLWQYLHQAGLELWSEQNQLLTPVFVLDQFEEVFTLGAENPAAIARLRVDLADLVENRMPAVLAGTVRGDETAAADLALDSQRYKVVLSFREDFLPAVEGWKRELPSILRNRLRLLPMSGEQALEAVHTTASHLMDEPLARRIVRFVAAAASEDGGEGVEGMGTGQATSGSLGELEVEPALLSLVCTGLNEKRKAQRKERFDEALLSGTGQAIIADYYAGAVEDLPGRVQRFVENELITERGFRRPYDVDDARTVHGVTDRELRLLVDRRLLRIEPQRGTERVELSHDLLTRVVREHRDRQRARERQRRQRRRIAIFAALGVVLAVLVVVFALLYRGAKFLLTTTEAQKQQIQAQKQRADVALETARKQKRLAEVALAEAKKSAAAEKTEHDLAETQRGLALAAASDAEAARLDAERKTRIATAQRLAAQADGALARFPQRGLLLAVEAARAGLRHNEPVVPEAEQALRRALAAIGGRGFGGPGAPVSAALSPQGRWLALAGDKAVYLLDLAGAQPARPLVLPSTGPEVRRGQDPAPHVGFGGDGRWLVVMAVREGPRVWDLSGKVPAASALSLPVRVRAVLAPVLSADRRWLVGWAQDGSTVLWDLARGDGPAHPLTLAPATPLQVVDMAGKSVAIGADAGSLAQALWSGGGLATLHAVDPAQRKFFLVGFNLPEVSPDGRWLVAVGEDHSIRLSDLAAADPASGSRLLSGDLGDRLELKIVFSLDSRWLAIGNNRAARVWNLTARDPEASSFDLAWPKSDDTAVAGLAISPDGHWLLAGSLANRLNPQRRPDTSAWLWNLQVALPSQASPLSLGGHEAGVTALAFSGDGRWAITGSDGGVVRLWDLTRIAQPVSSLALRGHEGGVYALAPSADGKWLVSEGADRSVRLWDLLRAPQPAVSPLAVGDRETVLAISRDSRWLATGGRDAGHLWDLRAPNPAAATAVRGELRIAAYGELPRVQFSPDGRWLAAADELDPGVLLDLTAPEIQESARTLERVSGSIAVSPDSRWLVMNSLWDLKPRGPGPAPRAVSDGKQALAEVVFSGDGRWAASSSEASVRLWNLAAKDPWSRPAVLAGHAKRISACRFSADSRWLFTASDDGNVQAWELTAGAPAARARPLPGHAASVVLHGSPDGRWLVTSDHGATLLWDLRSARPEANPHPLPGHAGEARQAAFTPDSRWLVTVDVNRAARLWDLRAANPAARRFELRGHEHGVDLLAMSPDSRWLATGGAASVMDRDRTVRLWNLASKDPSAAPLLLLGHEGGVSNLAISPDGRWLISGSEDATVRLWDLQAENPAAAPLVLAASRGPIRKLLVSPDGRWVVSGSEDGSVRLWHLRMADLIALAHDAAGRNLAPEEWRLYFQGQPYRKTFPDLP